MMIVTIGLSILCMTLIQLMALKKTLAVKWILTKRRMDKWDADSRRPCELCEENAVDESSLESDEDSGEELDPELEFEIKPLPCFS